MLRVAKTEYGMVQGTPGADARNTIFKGIPFAASAIGERMWKPPVAPEPWEGIRVCNEFAPITMQKVPGENPDAFYSKEWHVDPEVPMSEDGSLALNIYTPAKSADEKLPVMIWIFGGGMREGYAYEMEFDGESFCRRGVILVSIAYRLNVFGFLCHPDLTKENPDAPTNFGLLDQRFAIEWVKRNIANFGGDPERITIFGQSAGGGSTYFHITNPANQGLFQRAIAQSAGGLGISKPKTWIPMATEYDVAEERGRHFIEDILGCKSIDEARKLDPKYIEEKFLESGLTMAAVRDGKYIFKQTDMSIIDDDIIDIDFMYGNTDAEFMTKPGEDMEAWVKENFGDDADEYMEICKREAGSDDPEALRRALAVCGFELAAKQAGRMYAKHGRKAYYYVFGPTIPGDDAGAFHSSDLWFEFESLQKCWRPFDGHHYDLSRKMCNCWANFAKTGDPNGLDADGTPMPEWRPLTKDDQCVMYFKDEMYSESGPFTEKSEFLVKKNLETYGL